MIEILIHYAMVTLPNLIRHRPRLTTISKLSPASILKLSSVKKTPSFKLISTTPFILLTRLNCSIPPALLLPKDYDVRRTPQEFSHQ